MNLQRNYQLTLIFQGPLLTQASGTMKLGLDAEMQYYQDQPAISGSLIKGNIRHTLNEFDELLEGALKNDINSWFGNESIDQYKPQRTQIDFDFFWLLSKPYKKTQNQRTRISINQQTGVVKEGMLQIVEDCFPIGSDDPIFSGKITARFNDKKEQKQFEKWLDKALEYIPAMGSFKGIGWGKLLKATLEPQSPGQPTLSEDTLVEDSSRFGLQLELDRPFCLGRPRTPESNQIISDDFITGNVIKGLIARLYSGEDELEKKLCFNDLIITHALATDKETGKRIQPIPLSLTLCDGNVIDMAGGKKKYWKAAPKFSPDWKQEDRNKIMAAMEQGNINKPKRLVVVRTEINSENRVSEESKLFSLECINTEQHNWCADIDLCHVAKDKRVTMLKELQQIFNKGLTGIGKTKAQAKISIQLDKPYKPQTNRLTPGRQLITLITAARMLPPDLSIQGTNSAKQLKQTYLKYWQTALKDEDLILETYFAQETLTSTYYHQQRYKPKESYYPEWLTGAGSVFVLNINDEATLKNLTKLASAGLPAQQEVEGAEASWKTTPFLPEHGYGEIQINNKIQLNLMNVQIEAEK